MSDISFNLGEEPEEFLSIDAQLDQLNDYLTNFEHMRLGVKAESREETDRLNDRISTLQAKINDLYRQLQLVREKEDKKLLQINRERSEKQRQYDALKEAKARQELEGLYEKTAELIRDIVQDFTAWGFIREYQAQDVVSIVHQYVIGETGIMNANEMALGKTFESIVALYIIRELFKQENGSYPTVLWLTKSSIVKTGGTKREFDRWDSNYRLLSLDGSEPKDMREFQAELCHSGEIGLLTNYESVRTTKAIRNAKWDIVIMDEVHKIKGGANVSGPTQIWEAVRDTCRKSRFMMMLTGTPLVNRMEEMWSYLHIFDEDVFPDVKDFTRKYTSFLQVAGQFKYTLQADKLLRSAMKGRMIRRTAEEVGLQLPPVTREDIYLTHNDFGDPSQYKLYKQMREEFFVWLAAQGRALTTSNILDQLTRLLQINVLPVANFKIRNDQGEVVDTYRLDVRDSSKLDAAIEIIKGHEDQAVVFCRFNEPLAELSMRLNNEGFRTGIINSAESGKMGDYEIGFQNGEIDVLLLNSAMGEGLNLHKDPAKWSGGAKVGITLDRWWNNARNDQCFKRIVRPGATNPVFFYDLYVEHSVDDYIRALCDEKDAQFSALTDSKDVRPAEEWREYLEGLL